MREGRSDKIVFAAFALAVFTLAFLFGLTYVSEADALWHLKSGELIYQFGPQYADSFSFRTQGKEWLDAQWFFQLAIFLIYKFADFGGLSVFCALSIAATWLLLFLLPGGKKHYPATLLLVTLGLWASTRRFNLRPEVATYLVLALYILVLEKNRGKNRKTVYLLAPLQTLLANLEGLWPIGLFLIGAYLAEDVFLNYREKRKLSGPESKRLCLTLTLATAASIITPYHIKGFLFPLLLLRQVVSSANAVNQLILDLMPVFYPGDTVFIRIPLLILIALSGLAFCLSRSFRPAHYLIWLAFLYLGLTANRNAELLALAAVGFGSIHFAQYLENARAKIKIIYPAVLAIALSLAVFFAAALPTNYFYKLERSGRRFGAGFPARAYPLAAAKFLKDNGWKGKLYNEMISSGFLIWAGWPDWKVYVDGRVEVYGPDLLTDYTRTLKDPRYFEEEDRRYDFDGLFLYYRLGNLWKVIRYAADHRQWVPVYADPKVIIFLKDKPSQAEFIRRHRISYDELNERILAR
jgi:hypothetical protein